MPIFPGSLHRVNSRFLPVLSLCVFSGVLLAQTSAGGHPPKRQMSSPDKSALHTALDAYDAGDFKRAEPLLRLLVAKYPSSYEANEALGSLYAESGQPSEALKFLLQSCRLSPNQAIAQANLGAAYLKLAKPGEAVGPLQRAARLDPRNATTASNLGQALLLTRQPAAAERAYAQASALAPGGAELSYNWALASFESGSPTKANEILGAIPAAQWTEPMHSLAGDAAERTGNFEDALTHLQAAAQLNPSDANLYAVVVELLRHWNWDEAIRVASYAAERYPASTHFRLAQGIAYYANNAYKEAVGVFSSLLKKDPNNTSLADLLGRSCSLLPDGQDPACAEMYEFAMRHPGNPVTTTYAAVALMHGQSDTLELDKAANLLHAAIEADPQYAEAYLQLGVLEQSRQHWKESAAALKQSIALRPTSPEAHYRLSRAYAHLGQRQEAEAQIELHQTYAQQAKNSLNARLQEVMRFVLKPQ